jgi:predicted nucleic acid-binding protein
MDQEARIAAQEHRTVWVKTCYLDASALVKLVLDEPQSNAVRSYVNGRANLYTTSLCFAEAFGVLKRKWLKKALSLDDYYTAVRKLTREVRNRIRFDDMELVDPTVQEEMERLGKKHQLDMADALQLVTIRRGQFKYAVEHSASVLITADNGLAKAAAEERVRLWNCNEPLPAGV